MRVFTIIVSFMVTWAALGLIEQIFGSQITTAVACGYVAGIVTALVDTYKKKGGDQ